MNQTILALGALTILSGVAISYSSHIAHSHKVQIDLQLEIMAKGVATQVLDLVSYSAFDERVTPSELASQGTPSPGDFSEFSAPSQFGNSGGCSLSEPLLNAGTCDDLDDFSMPSASWMSIRADPSDSTSVPFEVNLEVIYVDPDNPDNHFGGSTRSITKKAIITLRSPYSSKGTAPILTQERLFSYVPD